MISSVPILMQGEIGIPRSALDDTAVSILQKALTRQVTDFDGNAQSFSAYREENGVVWLPRYFQREIYWNLVSDWKWSEGREYAFDMKATLDPERGQPASVSAMTAHIRRESSGVLVAPTGTGKTLVAYATAARFGRYIGVPVYIGHMMDNWVDHAASVLGLSPDQIGIVQGDRCDLGRPVTVMMIQSLLSRRYPDELYEQIGFICADEVHRYGAEVWRSVVAQFPARFRLGLSANPTRKDGLTDFITWSFGNIGHRAPRIRSADTSPPQVFVLNTDSEYDFKRYCRWEEEEEDGQWKPGDPHPTKYDKLLAKDHARNLMIAKEIVQAVTAGRSIIVLSSLVEHLATLRDLTWRLIEGMSPIERIVKNVPYPSDHRWARLDTLKANLKKPKVRERVFDADVIFATYKMGREALNVPKLDTAVFATPPGDPLQPVGRLREKAEDVDRKSLLVIDVSEATKYSQDRVKSRKRAYTSLGIPVRDLVRRTKK